MFIKNKQAFTLIELLVVIAVIGILSTFAVVSLNNARARARDAKRVANVKQIQLALELYIQDNNIYPPSLTFGGSLSTGSLVYMQTIPTAPTPPDGDCTEEQNNYSYSLTGNNSSSYAISFCLGSGVGYISGGVITATPQGINNWSCGNYFMDLRDDQAYGTVQIGSQCFMSENLNIGTRINAINNQTNNSTIEKYCYNNNEDSCNLYGGLYQWNEAMQYISTEGSQGICPPGWHIPTFNEFEILTNYVNDQIQYRCNGTNYYIGKALSSNSDWTATSTSCFSGNNQQTNNGTGFNGLPSGYRDDWGTLKSVNYYTFFWSSSLLSSNPRARSLGAQYFSYTDGSNAMSFGNSIRCLKN